MSLKCTFWFQYSLEFLETQASKKVVRAYSLYTASLLFLATGFLQPPQKCSASLRKQG